MAVATIKPLRGQLSLPFTLGENMLKGDAFCVYDDAGNAKIETCISKEGDAATFAKGYYNVSCMVDTNVIVVAYRDADNSNHGRVMAGEIQADNSIVWGTPFTFWASTTYYIDICSHATNGFCVTYRGTSNYAYIRAGTVDASQNITMGTESQSSVGTAYYNQICSPAAGKVVSVFRDSGAGNNLIGEAATISGNAITDGLGTALTSGAPSYISICSPSTDKIAYSYYLSGKGYARSALVSGISIGLPGTQSEFHPSQVYSTYIKSPSADKVVIAFRNYGDSSTPYARCTTLTGTTFDTWGDAVKLGIVQSYYQAIGILDTDKIVLMISNDVAPYTGDAIRATISGKAITISEPERFANDRATYVDCVGAGTDRYCLIWYDYGDVMAKALVVEGSLNTLPQCIGVLEAAGSLGDIRRGELLGSITKALSGMTVGRLQYIQMDGTISEVKSGYPIGLAVNADEALIGKRIPG